MYEKITLSRGFIREREFFFARLLPQPLSRRFNPPFSAESSGDGTARAVVSM